MTARSRIGSALIGLACLAVLASCPSPLSASRFGQVVVDFSGVSRGPGLPSNISSIDIAVTAADMAELRSTLASPRSSATLEVPAGKDRLFSVLAKDSAGKVRYVGSSFRDIRGGEVVDLSVLMAKVFYITYDANAADATGSPPADEYYYKAGDTVRSYDNPNGLSRPGYALSGWNTMPDGTGTTYLGDETFTMPEGDLTLYAVWELSVTYTVSFFLYGGVSGPEQSVPANGLASAPSPEPTRPGYAFGGWFKDMAYAAPWTFGSDRVSADLTLYAKWTPLSSAKDITSFGFAAPPATGAIAVNTIAITVPFGTNVTSLSPTVTHTGVSIFPDLNDAIDFTSPVTFIVAAADGSTKSYVVTVTVAGSGSKEITAFGFMAPAATGVITGTSIAVTVPFGTNRDGLVPSISHTGAGIAPNASLPQDFTAPFVYTVTAADASTQAYTVTVALAAPSADPDLSGMTLSPMALNETFMPAVTSYTAGAPSSFPTVSVTPTASHPSATIQVKINGGSFAGTPSGTPSASLSLDDPMGSNLLSVRVTAEDGTTTKDYSVVISKTVAVTVMADPNGTVLFDSMPPGTYEKTPGAALPIVATPNPGYSFNNWTGTANVSVPTAPSTTLTVGVTDSTATANHMPNNYIVTFDEQGGTPSAPATNSVTFGTPYSLMATTNRTGYTFGGWWTLPGGGGVEVNGGTIVTQTANHTVYAKWTINQYTVTYMANGATLGTVPGAQLDDFGATVTVAPNSGKLVGAVIQDGIRQRFLQWNTDAAGTGTNYSPGGSLVLGAANVTLYAQFSIDGSAIGKVGPAGGFVFHDKGSVSNGWRYLEAAPVNQASSVWSNVNAAAMGGAGTAIGTGAFNSILTMKQAGHASSAAQVCDAYSTTYDSIVYDDWFLPSKDEVNAAHSNLSATDFDIGAYWSSSETAATSAYCPSQASPAHNTLKEYAYPVRAVRAFAGPAPLYVIQYFANGADTGTPLGDPSFYPAGAAVNIGGVNDMIKSTYDFGGWNTEANGSGTDYPTGGATMPAGNLVLFAVWNPM